MDYGPICGLVLRRTTSPLLQLENGESVPDVGWRLCFDWITCTEVTVIQSLVKHFEKMWFCCCITLILITSLLLFSLHTNYGNILVLRGFLFILLGCLPLPVVASAHVVSHEVSATHWVLPGAHFSAVWAAHLYIRHAYVRPHDCTVPWSRWKILLTADSVSGWVLPSDSQNVQS